MNLMTVNLDKALTSHLLNLRILTWNSPEAGIPLKPLVLLFGGMEGLLLLLSEVYMKEDHILLLLVVHFELVLCMEPELLFAVEGMQVEVEVVDILLGNHLHLAWQLKWQLLVDWHMAI